MSKHDDMSLVEHLTELRSRIFWVAIVLVVGMVAGFFCAKPLINFLRNMPPANGMQWAVFSPWDSLRLYMNFSFVVGVFITVPVAMYHAWAFVKPGLRKEEQNASLIYIPFAILLLLVGVAFSYFVVFPMAFHFSQGIAQNLGFAEVYGAAQYFSFMFTILVPLSISFELPIVVMFLTKLRLLNPIRLGKMRRYAYLALVILATIISPPDAISAIVIAVPLIALYEFSVLLSRVVYRKQLEKEAEWEKEYGKY